MEANRVPAFQLNEKVLCFHWSLIYEAKVLEVQGLPEEDPKAERLYYIHYAGWSKKWDEYVPESRILKYTMQNLRRQKQHSIALMTRANRGRKYTQKLAGVKGSFAGSKMESSVTGDSLSTISVDSPRPSVLECDSSRKNLKQKRRLPSGSSNSSETNLKRRKLVAANVESEAKFWNKQVIEVSLPDKLKTILIEDFDKIIRLKKLLKLPGRHSVDSLLMGYKDQLKKESGTPKYHFAFLEGIKKFFNMMLGIQLLYRFERQQYEKFRQKAIENDPEITEEKLINRISSIYGPVHFIRLFSKLGTTLAFTTIEQLPLLLFKKFSAHLFEYILARFEDFFVPVEDYITSTPEYQKKSLT